MPSPEFDPVAHEQFVSQRLQKIRVEAARVALFDELIDMHHDGLCSYDEALAQFHHDAERDGIGYEAAS